MRFSKRNIGAIALAGVMALGTAGCDDNGGATGTKFYFNLVGSGQYVSLSVTVDLAAAGALIGQGTCALSSALTAAGCNVQTSEVANRLVITVSGGASCVISALTTVASCQLLEGNLSDVQAETEGSGVCEADSSCDTTPTICVSTVAGDFTCGGGGVSTTTTLGGGTSTTTTTSSTTTSSTTSSTTTSTTTSTTSTTLGGTTSTTTGGGGGIPCTVTLGVTSSETIASLQVDTDYSGASGDFVGSGGSVSCTSSINGLVTFNDDEASKTLTAGYVVLAGFTGPTDIATCDFTTSNPALAPSDFVVTVVDASDPSFSPLTPTVAVTNVTCTPGETTTTTGATTTTTTGATTTTTTGGTTTTTTGGTTTTTTGATTTTTTGGTTTTLPPAQFDIVFQLDDAVTVGALGFDVDYTAAPGDFVGSGGDAGAGGTLECSSLAAGALATFNDDDAGTLSAGYIALGGITGPADLATCVFQQSGPTAPVAGDFTITVTDASDTSLAPISPLPTVSVKSITPK